MPHGDALALTSDGLLAASAARPGRLPRLSRDEERELAMRCQGGDRGAAETLIHSHLAFVVSIARKYRSYGVPLNDLVQEGVIGFLHAISKFEPERGLRLSTYARWWVRAAIQEHVVRSWSLVRIGTTAAQRALFFRLRRMAVELREGADALTEDVLRPVAKRFGVPLREAVALARRAAHFDWSLNQRVADADGDVTPEWIDSLPDGSMTPEESASADSDERYRKGLIARALGLLSQRERAIITGRYLEEIKRTRDTIAAELGISKERVRQLEQAALEKLRGFLAPLKGAV